ncbi:unnamed protein product [Clonostachys chloroleuca]|uniref:Uncharacterized protein n=1 Tax=Clonostachys chloroleuca TaxID=1926264 RepID=A0AA35Q6Z2_9HYPO|nr:unnamed protein product [Clonostachys chloroleuca]
MAQMINWLLYLALLNDKALPYHQFGSGWAPLPSADDDRQMQVLNSARTQRHPDTLGGWEAATSGASK